jgi:predicted  nucleic acid-binding Zn-ribbon protein
MANLMAILKYQEVDTKLYKIEREIAACDERKEYVKLKKFLETAPEKLDSLEVKATSLKTQAEDLTKRYAATEETLKDFEHLDELVSGGADIAFYKKKAQSIVDQLKKLKADLNALTTAIKETDAEYQKLKKQVISAQKQYGEASEKYKAVKASREDERKAIESELAKIEKDVPEKMLEVYQTKRKERIFPVVGQLTSNRCPYCSMEPPIAARSKLTGGGVIECDNCHHVIYKN